MSEADENVAMIESYCYTMSNNFRDYVKSMKAKPKFVAAKLRVLMGPEEQLLQESDDVRENCRRVVAQYVAELKDAMEEMDEMRLELCTKLGSLGHMATAGPGNVTRRSVATLPCVAQEKSADSAGEASADDLAFEAAVIGLTRDLAAEKAKRAEEDARSPKRQMAKLRKLLLALIQMYEAFTGVLEEHMCNVEGLSERETRADMSHCGKYLASTRKELLQQARRVQDKGTALLTVFANCLKQSAPSSK